MRVLATTIVVTGFLSALLGSIELASAETLTVHVTSAEPRTDLPGVIVTVEAAVSRTSSTDLTGSVVFSDLPPGAYQVKGVLPGLGEDVATVCVGRQENRLELVLRAPPPHVGTVVEGVPPIYADLTGTVVAARTRRPLRGARIEVQTTAGALFCTALSDRDGRFALRDVLFGRYILRVTSPTYLAREVRVVHDAWTPSDLGTIHLASGCE